MESQGAGLPPIAVPAQAPGMPPMAGGVYPSQARPPQPANPVGRPSGDPDQQEARALRGAQQKRLEQLSPNRAKDQKLVIFRTVGGRSRGKAVLTILASEIDEHLTSCPPGADKDVEIDDFITMKLPETAPDGIYRCQWYDKGNRPINDPPAWELTVGEPIDDELDDGMGPLEEDPPGFMGGTMPINPAFAPPVPAAPTPPAPPALDLGVLGRVANQERQAEAAHGNQLMTLMAAQHQQQTQMMMQQQQWNKEAEEREKARRSEFRQTLMTIIPLALPFLSQLFGPKPAAAPVQNPTEALMLEIVKGKILQKDEGINPAEMMKQMLNFQTEMAKKQMDLQQTGTATAMAMQGEATSLVFKNMLSTMQELMKNKPAASEEKSTLATIAEIAGPILAAVQAQQQQPAAALPGLPAAAEPRQPPRPAVKEQPPAPAPSAVVGPPAAPAAPAAAEQRRRPAARRAPDKDPTKFTEAQRIQSVLLTVRRMSIGEVPPQDRWGAIDWVCKWMPPSVVEAVKAKNEPKVLELSAMVVLGNATLQQWISDADNQTFLRDVLEDARLLLTKEVTESMAEASVIKAGVFVQRRQQAQAIQAAKDQAAIDAHNNPDSKPVAAPAVDATLVTDPTAGIAPPAVDATVVPPPKPPTG